MIYSNVLNSAIKRRKSYSMHRALKINRDFSSTSELSDSRAQEKIVNQ